MSSRRLDGDHTSLHYTTAGSHEHAPTAHHHAQARITRAAPKPEVAAAEFLLAEPDTYLYRRRYLELITHAAGPDGTTITDYTAAEEYLLTTAARRRETAQRTTTLSVVEAR